jgi:D-alanyl-D-alanine carboxypeptidase
MEQGKFTLDTPIDKVLKPATVQILKDGGYKPNIILVRHLLEHTAGMYDYTQSDKFNKVIFNQPNYRWTREEQLKLAMTEGKVLGPPGNLYEYGDTQYILLGEILELQTNMDLAKALRTVLRFDALGLKDSWMETLENEPTGGFARLSHPIYGTVDTRSWDPSWDLFGAGGLVSSTQDLVKFMDALFAGKIFKNKTTLDIMINIPQVSIGGFGGLDGGMGINRTTIAGNVCYAGYGFFGTEMIRCPSIDVTLARTTNQSINSSKYDSDVLNAKLLKLFIK